MSEVQKTGMNTAQTLTKPLASISQANTNGSSVKCKIKTTMINMLCIVWNLESRSLTKLPSHAHQS